MQTCSKDESCHSDAVHPISTLSTPYFESNVFDGNLTQMAQKQNLIRPFSGALSVCLRMMSWKSCGVSKMI